MICKNEKCDNEAKGRGLYCSASCKTVYNRNSKSVTFVTETKSVTTNNHNSDRTVTKSDTVVGQAKQVRDLDKNCVKPLSEWDGTLSSLTDQRLQDRLTPMRSWQGSQAYAEVCHRLTHEKEPKNQPCWLRSA